MSSEDSSAIDARHLHDARRLGALLTSLDSARRILDHRANLGAADMRLLWLFHDGVSRTLREIAEELGLEQSTVNRQVNTAVNEGLLNKSRAQANAPYRFMSSTTGVRAFEKTLQVTLEVHRQALESLGSERETFLALLDEYVQAYHHAVTEA